jgi:hypothetical protein
MINAQWFKGLYDEHQFPRGAHIRRIHYRLISQEEPVIMPNGGAFENTGKCAAFLVGAARDARYAGLVEIEAFTDRKNPEPQDFLPGVDGAPVIMLEENEEESRAGARRSRTHRAGGERASSVCRMIFPTPDALASGHHAPTLFMSKSGVKNPP